MDNHMMQGSCKIIELETHKAFIKFLALRKKKKKKKKKILCHTKYVVGANANPPKKLRSPPKKGKVIPMNMVSAATKKIQGFFMWLRCSNGKNVLKLRVHL
jgi:hypothetical protein